MTISLIVMQVSLEEIGEGLSIFFQVAEIILGFIIFLGITFYLGIFVERPELYNSRLYESKMVLVFRGLLSFSLLVMVMIASFLFLSLEHQFVNLLNFITIVSYLAILILYVLPLIDKRGIIKLRRTSSRTIIYNIIFFLISVPFVIYSLNNPIMEFLILSALLFYFIRYIYKEGIDAGKISIDNLSKVTVITTYGKEENLKLYQTTNIDYRFIRDNKEEIIIPKDKVIRIITEKC